MIWAAQLANGLRSADSRLTQWRRRAEQRILNNFRNFSALGHMLNPTMMHRQGCEGVLYASSWPCVSKNRWLEHVSGRTRSLKSCSGTHCLARRRSLRWLTVGRLQAGQALCGAFAAIFWTRQCLFLVSECLPDNLFELQSEWWSVQWSTTQETARAAAP